MINNAGFDRRKNSRVIAEELPESLRECIISLNSHDAITAQTLDISRKGIALLVPLCVKDINSIFITISSLDHRIMIKEQILSVRGITDKTSRVSIMFSKQNPFFELMN